MSTTSLPAPVAVASTGDIRDRSQPRRDPFCEGAFHHGLRSRWNAWFFGAVDRYVNRLSRQVKQEAFTGLADGTVVELGPGVGSNLAYLPVGSRLIAVEPNLAMHGALRRRAKATGITLDVISGGAESIPLPDESVDEMICTLVLCTMQDPHRVLAEVRRVLRPGGRFRFVEHVSAAGSGRRVGPTCPTPPWAWVFEGCQLDRDTHRTSARPGSPRSPSNRTGSAARSSTR